MNGTTEAVFRIAPTVQKYDWGKVGNQSKVAQLAAGADIPGFALDNSAPYAEASRSSLWSSFVND